METKRQSVAENVAAMARAAEAAAARRLAAAEAAAQTKATATPAAEPSGRDVADGPAIAVAAEEENEAGVAEGAEGDYCSQTCHDGLHIIIWVCLHRSVVNGVSTVPDRCCFVLNFEHLLQLLTALGLR